MALVDHFIPLLASLREFQNAPRDDAAALAARIDALLASARRAACDDGLAPEDFDAALFPIVAWADEALIALDWVGAREWPRRLLQKRYFNLSTAGIEFFKRLDQLGNEAIELKEVYFLCLCLGFQGRYSYERNLKALADVRQQLLSTLTPNAALAGARLIPEGYQGDFPAAGGDARRRRNWPNWRFSPRLSPLSTAIVLLPLLILGALYGAYHLILSHAVTSIIQQL